MAYPRALWFSLLLAATFSIFATIMILQSVNIEQTKNLLFSSNLGWFGVAFLLQMISTGFVLLRWQILLRPRPFSLASLAQIIFVAQLFNTLLPAKMGTVVRGTLAAQEQGSNVVVAFGSIAVEKLMDMLVMLALFLAAALFIPFPAWLRDMLWASMALLFVGLPALVLLNRMRDLCLNFLDRIETFIFRHRKRAYMPRASKMIRDWIESIAHLWQRGELPVVLIWTLGIWLMGILVNQALFLALDMSIPWIAALFVILAGQLGARVPALNANIGVFHYVTVLSLAVYSVDENTALAFAILLHLIVFILPALIGAACALPIGARIVALASNEWRRWV